jgi:hypothetical protein
MFADASLQKTNSGTFQANFIVKITLVIYSKAPLLLAVDVTALA